MSSVVANVCQVKESKPPNSRRFDNRVGQCVNIGVLRFSDPLKERDRRSLPPPQPCQPARSAVLDIAASTCQAVGDSRS
jgi:hypothetical protein